MTGLFRMVFAVLWVLVAAGLYLRNHAADGPGAPVFGTADIVVVVAVALAWWNIARWYTGRRRLARTDGPLRPRPEREEPREYNPEFDFSRQPREK